MTNATWDLVPRHSASSIVGCKWVFQIKRKPNGSIEHYKVRLVAKGFNQKEGVDYFDTFNPVIKPTAIRLVLSIAITQNWSLRQVDINNAFLNGDLEETVYMEKPQGFIAPDRPSHVCKLKKAFYGLKPASMVSEIKSGPARWFQAMCF